MADTIPARTRSICGSWRRRTRTGIYYLDPARSTYYDGEPQTAFRKTMRWRRCSSPAPAFRWSGTGRKLDGVRACRRGGQARPQQECHRLGIPGGRIPYAHYQKLAHAAGSSGVHPAQADSNGDGSVNASDSSDFMRVQTGNGVVYAFSRPYPDENGLTVSNFSGDAVKT